MSRTPHRGCHLVFLGTLHGVRPRTLYQVLEEAARAHGDAPALIQPGSPPWSWNQYRQAVDEIAAGLRALGIGKGDIVALNSETRLEFYLADLGIIANGSVAAALYPSYPSKDLVRTMETAGACAAFIENPEMLEALRDIQPGSPPWSWNQYRQAVDEIAAGLRALGIGKGDIVALNSETRLEFYLADLGILANGSVAAALYPSYPSKDLVRTMESAGACAAFIENPEMLEALRQAPVRQWILLTGRAAGALALDDLREMGRKALAARSGLDGAAKLGSGPLRPGGPVSHFRRHRRAQDGAGDAPGHRVQHRHGSGGAAAGAGRFHGGVSALGAHRAARGDGIPAHPLRHAGDLRREPAEAAAGNPQGAAHHSAGAAAHVGAHLLDHLHGTAQAPGSGAQAVLWRAGAGAGGGALPPRRASRCRCEFARP